MREVLSGDELSAAVPDLVTDKATADEISTYATQDVDSSSSVVAALSDTTSPTSTSEVGAPVKLEIPFILISGTAVRPQLTAAITNSLITSTAVAIKTATAAADSNTIAYGPPMGTRTQRVWMNVPPASKVGNGNKSSDNTASGSYDSSFNATSSGIAENNSTSNINSTNFGGNQYNLITANANSSLLVRATSTSRSPSALSTLTSVTARLHPMGSTATTRLTTSSSNSNTSSFATGVPLLSSPWIVYTAVAGGTGLLIVLACAVALVWSRARAKRQQQQTATAQEAVQTASPRAQALQNNRAAASGGPTTQRQSLSRKYGASIPHRQQQLRQQQQQLRQGHALSPPPPPPQHRKPQPFKSGSDGGAMGLIAAEAAAAASKKAAVNRWLSDSRQASLAGSNCNSSRRNNRSRDSLVLLRAGSGPCDIGTRRSLRGSARRLTSPPPVPLRTGQARAVVAAAAAAAERHSARDRWIYGFGRRRGKAPMETRADLQWDERFGQVLPTVAEEKSETGTASGAGLKSIRTRVSGIYTDEHSSAVGMVVIADEGEEFGSIAKRSTDLFKRESTSSSAVMGIVQSYCGEAPGYTFDTLASEVTRPEPSILSSFSQSGIVSTAFGKKRNTVVCLRNNASASSLTSDCDLLRNVEPPDLERGPAEDTAATRAPGWPFPWASRKPDAGAQPADKV
ncbi:hypothetical protein HDU82_008738 [Entophlyctis luteolus]|nr:hypothetical protein HDU82_008738 [Entophlyctis luteolus]